MINIDIVEQLVPNVYTMIVKLCSTLVLFLLMKKFLWKSVKKFMNAREEKMQSDLAASAQAKQDALGDRQKALSELQEASSRSKQIVDAAVQQAKDEKTNILAQANQEADAVRKKAQEQIESERQDMYRSMQKEMVDVAMAAAGKLIGEKSNEEMDRKAVDAFVKEAAGNEQ